MTKRLCSTLSCADCTAPLSGFFFNDPATTEIYTLSLHDALPICCDAAAAGRRGPGLRSAQRPAWPGPSVGPRRRPAARRRRSEEHTSELQSRQYLVCRLLLEKKNEQH